MGFSGLARWDNAPSDGLNSIKENILLNHGGIVLGKWSLSVLAYRSNLSQMDASHFLNSERSMFALTMNDNVFVLIEDPGAPNHTEVDTQGPPPTHFRSNYLTLSPPGALEHLLKQLKARWTPVRQSNNTQRGQQVIIEGQVFGIGTDWIVRAGHVYLAGGALNGMLLEAEYLPIPVIPSHLLAPDGGSDLIKNFILSVLPNIPGARTGAIAINEAMWEHVLWNREEEAKRAAQRPSNENPEDPDDIYVYGDEDIPTFQPGDWTGIERDRRSAFLIISTLKSEGIL